MMKRAWMVAVGLGLNLIACGKSDPGSGGAGASATSSSTTAAASKGICNKVAAVGKCNEESGDPDADKAGCELTHGAWSVGGSCPTDKVFATCNYGTTKIFYYAGAQGPDALIQMSEDFAKTDCDLVSGKYGHDHGRQRDPCAGRAEAGGSDPEARREGEVTPAGGRARSETQRPSRDQRKTALPSGSVEKSKT